MMRAGSSSTGRGKVTRDFWGTLLILVGWIIVGLSLFAFLIFVTIGAAFYHEEVSRVGGYVTVVLIFSVAPLFAGLIMAWIGRRLRPRLEEDEVGN